VPDGQDGDATVVTVEVEPLNTGIVSCLAAGHPKSAVRLISTETGTPRVADDVMVAGTRTGVLSGDALPYSGLSGTWPRFESGGTPNVTVAAYVTVAPETVIDASATTS